jgi:3-oxoacyl-[acyl-carrier-protein] synthase II
MNAYAHDPCIGGLGVLGSFGLGIDALRLALAAGRPALQPVGAGHAALVPRLDLTRHVAPAAARRMSLSSHWGVAVAKAALLDAGLSADAAAELPLSVDVATTFGPSRFTEQLVQQFQRGDPQLCSPFLFTDCVANAPAGQIAIETRARGANTTWCQREAGQVLALLAAARNARHGRALAAVVDEMPAVVHAALASCGALTRSAARPFDRARDGFVAGEGASAFVIEARDRCERPLARVRAGGSAFDPTATTTGWGNDAERLAAAIGACLDRAGVASGSIGAVVCSASGSVLGDRLEARVLRAVFGQRLPALLVPKAVLGEYGGGVLATAVLALQGARFARPGAFETADPELGVVPHGGEVGARLVLVTAFAAGGAAAWAVLERP